MHADAMGLDFDVKAFNLAFGNYPPPIRGRVSYGMSRVHLRNLARSLRAKWSILNGKLIFTPLSGYSDTEAVVINSRTGMVGLPEQTEDGIKVTCLLNPLIVPGTQVRINQSSIQRASVSVNPAAINQVESAFPAVTGDGFYTAMAVEHEGDTRGNPWYAHITALAVDKTSPAATAVKAYG